jgi:hypothetical protein
MVVPSCKKLAITILDLLNKEYTSRISSSSSSAQSGGNN